jgi:hypothetical protein
MFETLKSREFDLEILAFGIHLCPPENTIVALNCGEGEIQSHHDHDHHEQD